MPSRYRGPLPAAYVFSRVAIDGGGGDVGDDDGGDNDNDGDANDGR